MPAACEPITSIARNSGARRVGPLRTCVDSLISLACDSRISTAPVVYISLVHSSPWPLSWPLLNALCIFYSRNGALPGPQIIYHGSRSANRRGCGH